MTYPHGSARRNGWAGALVVAGFACGPTRDGVDQSEHAIVYGTDDRADHYASPSVAGRQRLSESMVAFIRDPFLDPDHQLSSAVPPWAEAQDLCPGASAAASN